MIVESAVTARIWKSYFQILAVTALSTILHIDLDPGTTKTNQNYVVKKRVLMNRGSTQATLKKTSRRLVDSLSLTLLQVDLLLLMYCLPFQFLFQHCLPSPDDSNMTRADTAERSHILHLVDCWTWIYMLWCRQYLLWYFLDVISQ